MKQRMILELYLAIPGFANRKYVVERLQGKHFSAFINYLILESHVRAVLFRGTAPNRYFFMHCN